ncbi:MAG: ERF family protein [Clostridiales bacterium]|nr:ERF family protein [Clostridiales bacterium]MBQ1572345.1 ERF family protein [Clostridiales bacterium]
MNLKEKLIGIQSELKCPKDLTNKFGGYNYRNAEGILEAVKPLLKKYKCTLRLEDHVHRMGDGEHVRYYIESIAFLSDCESEEVITNQALARESDDKKGMDASQITGACSSYARKYCLNGLFLLDDVKDADSEEFENERKKRDVATPKANKDNQDQKIGKEEYETLKAEALRTGTDSKKLLSHFKVKDINDLTMTQYQVAINKMSALPDKEK